MENMERFTPLYAIAYAIMNSMENLRFDKDGYFHVLVFYGLFYKRNRKHFPSVPIPLRPIFTIRFVVYDCQVGVCDLLYTRVNGVFQHLPWNYKQELFHVQTITYARMTIVYDKSYRVNGPL